MSQRTSRTKPAAAKPTAEERLIKEIDTLHGISAGVVIVRSREPLLAVEGITAWAAGKGKRVATWDMTTGTTLTDSATGAETVDGSTVGDPAEALRLLKTMPPETVLILKSLHPWTAPSNAPANPMVLQSLQNLAWMLSADEQHRMVIAITRDSANVPAEIAADVALVDHELPEVDELLSIITRVISGEAARRNGPPISYTAEEFRALAVSASGLTTIETEASVSRIIYENKDILPDIPFSQMNSALMRVKADMVRATGFMEVVQPRPMSEIGGLDRLKAWTLKKEKCFSVAARDAGVKRPRGCTLIGPPGTGKSASASAIASVLRRPMVKLSIGSLFGGIVGESEANTRRALSTIKALGEVVVFVDEIDRTMGMKRAGGDGGINDRLIGTLLDFMQSNESGAFFVFAANNAEGIDSALIRKGRMDMVWAVLPPNAEERLAILRIHIAKAGYDPDEVPHLNTVVEQSEGYVGAELEAAVAEAVADAYIDDSGLCGTSILKYIVTVKPLSVAFKDEFERQARWAENNAEPASSPTGGMHSPGRPQQQRRSRVPLN